MNVADYEPMTVMGKPWFVTADYGASIDGYIVYAQPVYTQWTYHQGQALNCGSNREFNVALRPSSPAPSFTNSVRALDTDFIISADRDAQVSYTVECYVPVTLLASNSAADVVLKVNGEIVSNPGESLDVTLALGLSLRPTHRKTFSARVPAGATVSLTSVIAGAGTATYLYGQETLL